MGSEGRPENTGAIVGKKTVTVCQWFSGRPSDHAGVMPLRGACRGLACSVGSVLLWDVSLTVRRECGMGSNFARELVRLVLYIICMR